MSDLEVVLKLTTDGQGHVFIEDAEGETLAALEAPEEDDQSKTVFCRNLARDIQSAWLQIDQRN